MTGRGSGEARAAFAEALARLRRELPDVSDETLARRAGRTALPSGRRVEVNARRLGEWLGGRSVPRDFDVVVAVVRAVETAVARTGPGPAPRQSIAQWERLWRAAYEERSPARNGAAESSAGTEPGPAGAARGLAVGRPPSDAAALRERPDLAGALDSAIEEAQVRQVVLTGAGGVGKSQLAAAAFHRARQRGQLAVWVPASSRQSALTACARAWRVMAGEGAAGARDAGGGDRGWDEEAEADLFVGWLRTTTRPWLVVLDDVDDPAELAGIWPVGDHGTSVVTTRRRDASVIRPSARIIRVGMFTPEEAAGYLRARLSAAPGPSSSPASDSITGPQDDTGVESLAEALGCFPLALSQAAAFVIDTGLSLAQYRRLLDDQQETLADLFPSSSPADEHGGTVSSTFRPALERAETLAHPGTVRAALELVAMLAPGGIPEVVLHTGAARRWIGKEQDRPRERDVLLALRALHRLSLVTHDSERGPATVEAHALVQRAARETVPAGDRPALAAAAADALEEVWASREIRPDLAAALYRNVEALRLTAGDLFREGRMHPVLRRTGPHLTGLGRAAAARDTCSELLVRARARLGEGHRDVLILRSQVAQAVGDLGNATTAHAELTAIRREAERNLGAADPDTLSVRLHEARFLMESGAVGEASEAFTTLAADAARALGPGAALTLDARGYAAMCRGLAGDAVAARDAYAAVVEDLERERGLGDPATLGALTDLGRWIGEAGDPDAAVEMHLKAVDALCTAAGPLHHDTLVARHNLAYWRGLAGSPEQAVEEFAAAAHDAERALGADHPTTLTCRVNLAFWSGLTGRPADAVTELAGLQPLIDRILGADHPRALRTRQQSAELQDRAGDRAGATTRLTILLADMTRVQGAEHPRTREVAELLKHWGSPAGS
ncbi:tetratricopeptide repeat protein [Streptomyces sp. SID13666]|uniref:tetratricopeptide repeat protein n=1 Tax=Streptomyces sp. SID13666 TaxID=2706054 RepID=UPI0013C0F87B|nr:tetratricopeptide repeat protein [Streptomyces sp. SID13666]NEA52620.1 tetratricopeptide repeat protein [Streptomyces sp. SID13666]